MQSTNNEAHPIELDLVAAVVVLEAAITLLVALAALVLTVARWRPAAPAPAAAQVLAAEPIAAIPAAPLAHPLQQLAVDALHHLPVAQLRSRARAAGIPRPLTRSARKVQLVAALAGLEAALI